jgi:hypothetical protein
MNEESLAGLLWAETDAAPPSGVDLDRVLHDGRRRRRRRALVGPAVVALIAAIVTLGATLVTVGDPPPGVDPDFAAPTAFDPLELRLAVGWRPPTLDAGVLSLGTDRQELSYTDSIERAPIVTVTMYAAGRTPWQQDSPSVVVRAADPVHRAPARWYGSDGRTDALAWKWARDAWAVVVLDRVADPAGNRETLRRIANSVGTNLGRSVRPPYIVDFLPGGTRLVGVTFGTYESVGYQAMYRFDDDPDDDILVEVGPPGNDPSPDRVIGGRPARVEVSPTTYQVRVYQPGYRVQVVARGVNGPPRVSAEAANAIALSVRTERSPTMVD